MAVSPSSARPVKPSRNRRPRPERRAALGTPTDGHYPLLLSVGKDVDAYILSPLAHDFGAGAFRLHRLPIFVKPGEADHYDVLLDGRKSTCECPGFERYGWHLDANGDPVSCKHCDGLLALVANGRLALPSKPAAKSTFPANFEADFA
jgi:hypothetical protein